MVTEYSQWRARPRVSYARFGSLLAGSPVLAERSADEYFVLCADYGVDPLFLLAMFKHESDLGRRFSFPEPTKSWGNVGFPNFGPLHVGTVRHPLTGKEFPVYRDWKDGLEATLARLTSPSWVYHNRLPIRELFIHPSGQVWAPAGDMNNPSGYLNTVIRYMNANSDVEEEMPNALAKLTTRQASPMLPWNAVNNPRAIMTGQWPDWITIHETGNPRPGTGAENHRRFVIDDGGGEDTVSFHAVVDDKESIQLMPWNWVAWHAGDGTWGTGNRDSIAIETCQNSDGDFARTVRNLVLLVAKLMKEFGLPISRVVPHRYWSGKNCPEYILNNKRGINWDGLIAAIKVARNMLDTPVVNRPPGFLQPVVDTFDWGPDSAGIIVERQVLVFNPEQEKGKQWYRGTWRAESGITWETVG